ncbi:uncharacterized protein G2W53_022278 [Senna tora]|uniref:Uncharacterized protein n=1 Tax=Senna tora TaxID=362788 RepID=A0A834WP14_9FABA|nr:uncharacterized protein G2W53_022278 [Senna tora]
MGNIRWRLTRGGFDCEGYDRELKGDK